MVVADALRRPGVSRVMVVDWDVHHGNGTEDIFYGSADVLYVSTHQQGIFPLTGGPAQQLPFEASEPYLVLSPVICMSSSLLSRTYGI